MRRTRMRVVLPALYGLAFAAALGFLLLTLRQTAFCGVYLIMVTLPWSLLSFPLLQPCTEELPPGLCLLLHILVLTLCGILNAALLYLVGRVLDRIRTRLRTR